MRAQIIVALLLTVFLVAACGGTITGQAVGVESIEDSSPESNDADSNDDNSADNSNDESGSNDDDVDQPNIIMEGPTEEQKAFAELYEGRTCEEDSSGVVRVFTDGQKEVFRNTCLGDLLIDYGCENGQLSTENTRCPSGCEYDKYRKGKCA